MWKSLVGDDEEQGESLLGEDSGGLCSLSPTQRIYGFAACLIAGLACITAFLLGPAQQLGMMFDTARVFATAIYIGCVVIALICALLIHDKLLTIIAIIIEIGALIWYSLSYIPFALGMTFRSMSFKVQKILSQP
ncbi:hypothetical protein Ahy_A06g030117 isoform D [Arachis hypogaea]|uniref:Vesicle transport protein n=1 Tax=Arachis hypogaea TaxID=3818 RepID=A0A445CVC7_ARAHY|nr:hypothetical protein Ahy_A06g030117 isoform D [Arachis hypogaea]